MSLLKSGECFICVHDDDVYTRLADQNLYEIDCKCDGWVHTRCHEEWFRLNRSCPICRESKVELKKNDIHTYVNVVISLLIYAFLIYIIIDKYK